MGNYCFPRKNYSDDSCNICLKLEIDNLHDEIKYLKLKLGSMTTQRDYYIDVVKNYYQLL